MRFPSQRHQVGDYLDEQGRIQPLIGQLHGVYVQDGFEDFPELLNRMMGFPYMPDFCAPQKGTTEIDQVIAARGAFSEEEEHHVAKGRTVRFYPQGGHVYPPGVWGKREALLPGGGRLFFLPHGKDIVAFASQ